MTPELIAILAVGVGLAGLLISGQRSAAGDRQAIREELRSGFQAAAGDRQAIREEFRSGFQAAAEDRQAIREEFRSGFQAAAEDRQAIRQELAAIRADLRTLGERTARLEGAFPFLAARPNPPDGQQRPT